MTRMWRVAALALVALCGAAPGQSPARAKEGYFPPPGRDWRKIAPEQVGMDAAKLAEAVAYAQANGSNWSFEKDQVRTFGAVLGPLPARRAETNGVILRHGYIVAEFGDVFAADPVYSVAKSFLSTVCGIAVDRKLIRSVDDPVAKYVHDGGYDSPQNKDITWRHHLQQVSEWQGEMWGKKDDFVGREAFGAGQRQPRGLQKPGSFYEYNDVRVNRFSLSLLRVFGKPLPEVLKTAILDPIGASGDWQWLGYGNSNVEIQGKPAASVSGGTRWGGGLWIHSRDLARAGLLMLNRGRWNGKRLLSEAWIAEATRPGPIGPDYGFLWWLNTQKKQWPSAPASSYAALGNGSNTVWIDPEHDIVLVWHWHQGRAMDGMIQRVLAALTPAGRPAGK